MGKMIFFSPDDIGGGGGEATGGAASSPVAPSQTAPATSTSPQTGAAGSDPGSPVGSDADASILGEHVANGGGSYVRADGTFETDWQNKLPDEFASTRESLSKFKNVNDLIKAYDSANKLVGRKGVILPEANSSPEEVAAYRKAMGVPESPDGYAKETMPDAIPEGIQWSDEIAKSYFEVAHKHNIPPSAMKALIALNLKHREFELQAQNESIMETKQQGMSFLRHRWGVDFDRNLGIAQRAVVLEGGNVNSYGWRDPDTVRVVVGLASRLGEGKLVAPGGSLPMGSADLRARAIDIITNKNNPDHAKYHDGDKETQSRVRRYLEQASGGK